MTKSGLPTALTVRQNTDTLLEETRNFPTSPHASETCSAGVPPHTLTKKIGGGERDRTDDLLLAKQALSQLSYAPDKSGGPG